MSSTTLLPNGLLLTSSALTVLEMNTFMQAVICKCLGLAIDFPILGGLTAGSARVTDATGGALGWEVVALGIPEGTTIIAVDGFGVDGFGSGGFSAGSFTLSAPSTVTRPLAQMLVTDPVVNTAVRTTWAQNGQPGFGINDDVVFVSCFEVPDDYNLVRNEDWAETLDSESVSKTEEYTRVWEVSLEFRGPHSYDNARLVKSALVSSAVHDTLAVTKLYLHADVGSPRRAPELYAGQWWERTNLELRMNEDVQESISIPIVASAEIITETAAAIVSDITIYGPQGFDEGGFGQGVARG